jgi:hypothetical protein
LVRKLIFSEEEAPSLAGAHAPDEGETDAAVRAARRVILGRKRRGSR